MNCLTNLAVTAAPDLFYNLIVVSDFPLFLFRNCLEGGLFVYSKLMIPSFDLRFGFIFFCIRVLLISIWLLQVWNLLFIILDQYSKKFTPSSAQVSLTLFSIKKAMFIFNTLNYNFYLYNIHIIQTLIFLQII